MNTTVFRNSVVALILVITATSFFGGATSIRQDHQRPSLPATSVSSSSSCSLQSAINVTDGTILSVIKFVVTSADCCNYCSTLPEGMCVAAVYHNYYCYPYAVVASTGAVSDSSVVFISLVTTTTAAPTTAVPTTTVAPAPIGPPKGFALLTECTVSDQCSRLTDTSCVTEVVPLDTCARTTSGEYLRVGVNVAGNVVRHAYKNHACSGSPSSSVEYPQNCTFILPDCINRMGSIEMWLSNETSSYEVIEMSCSNALCQLPSGCQTTAKSAADQCNDDSSSASSSDSSSTSSSSSSDAYYYHCFPRVNMLAKFSFSTSADCYSGERVVGYALPTSQCYYDDLENHYYNLCNPA